jgi:hypothetical protein
LLLAEVLDVLVLEQVALEYHPQSANKFVDDLSMQVGSCATDPLHKQAEHIEIGLLLQVLQIIVKATHLPKFVDGLELKLREVFFAR